MHDPMDDRFGGRGLQRWRDGLFILLAIIVLLYLGRAVLIPLAYSLLTAMVLYPVVSRMERQGIPRWGAILLGLMAVAIMFTAIGGIFLWELNAFRKELPVLVNDARAGMNSVRAWLGTLIGLPAERILGSLPEDLLQLFIRSTDVLFGMVFNLVIIPVLTALLLYNREGLVVTLVELSPVELRGQVPAIVRRSVQQFAAFILGMVKVYVIVGMLNTIGLAVLGIPNALLFGMLTAVMTIIPYVGIIVSAMLPISMAWLSTRGLWQPAGVVAVFTLVQYLEANIIFPKVVGAQLGLNTLASIVIIFIGAAIWGVSGMVLLLPFSSIFLIASEDIPAWAPLRLLLARSYDAGKDRLTKQ